MMLPKYINPLRLAEHEETITGQLPLKLFHRLSDLLIDDEGVVKINLRFGRDAQYYHYVLGFISSTLILRCQRCLQPIEYPIAITVSLSPVFSLETAKKLPAHYEPLWLETEQIEVVEMIEEELLLALPLIPKHDAAQCPVAS